MAMTKEETARNEKPVVRTANISEYKRPPAVLSNASFVQGHIRLWLDFQDPISREEIPVCIFDTGMVEILERAIADAKKHLAKQGE
jgi:hypothetical protein